MKPPAACLSALACHFPSAKLTSEDLAAAYPGWSVEKIEEKTGIAERRISAPREFASDLAVAAAQRLFAAGLCQPAEIDALILCTQSPDYLLPTTACLVQARLGLSTQVAAFDLNLGCSGFIYGLGIASGLVATGQARRVLLITADTYSKFIHPNDKSVRTLFGDGAAAALITAETPVEPRTHCIQADENGAAVPAVLQLDGPFVYGTDGRGGPNLIVPTRGAKEAYSAEAPVETDAQGNQRTRNNLYMNGAEIFTFTLEVVAPTVRRLLEQGGITQDQVDLFVFHQANQYMLEHLRKKLVVPKEKFFTHLRNCGNTVSSTIPIALVQAIRDGRISPGQTLMLVGFGVGYSWGGTLVHVVPTA